MSLALIELLISVTIGIMTVYLTKTVLMRFYLQKTHEIDPYKNVSFMIFLSGTIFSVSYLLFGIMEPLSSTIKLLSVSGISNTEMIFQFLKYLAMFLVLGYAFSATIVFVTYKLFSMLTRQLDEYQEIKNNNVGVAILLSVLTIVAALFSKHPFIIFIETFIPYPDLPGIM